MTYLFPCILSTGTPNAFYCLTAATVSITCDFLEQKRELLQKYGCAPTSLHECTDCCLLLAVLLCARRLQAQIFFPSGQIERATPT
jgi:hypothetical protein